jgi:hypothetical protein
MIKNRNGPHWNRARGDPPFFGVRGDPKVIKNNRDGPFVGGLILNILVGFFRPNGEGMVNYQWSIINGQ